LNIFFLDFNPRLAASCQCDKHVVKMVLESVQLLSTAHHVLGSGEDWMYQPTHVNHPSAVWCREAVQNYRWLWTHAIYLCAEYTYRYSKTHKTEEIIERLQTPPNIARHRRTSPSLAMPDECKQDCPVLSYREYYRQKKEEIEMRWTKREQPQWLTITYP